MKTPETFMEYFRKNYPGPNTIIHDPDWHAPKIYRVALTASAFADLLAACEKTLKWIESVRVSDPDDPLQKLQDQFHGPYREMLAAAIAKARVE